MPDAHLSWQLPDADVAQRQGSAVIALDADIAFSCEPVVRVFREFARRDFRFPVIIPELVFEDLLAVEPVLDMRALRDDTRLIPPPERFDDSRGRTGQGIYGSRSRQAALAIGRVRVVEQLILRCTPINVIIVASCTIE